MQRGRSSSPSSRGAREGGPVRPPPGSHREPATGGEEAVLPTELAKGGEDGVLAQWAFASGGGWSGSPVRAAGSMGERAAWQRGHQ